MDSSGDRRPMCSGPHAVTMIGMNDIPGFAAEGLTKSYRGRTAVDGLDLSVQPGEIFGLLGPNGAGKTTTVEMLAGLRKPSAGRAMVLGLDPWRDRKAVRQVLGVQLQNAYLHHALTVRELVKLHRSFYSAPRDTDEALDLVGLTDQQATRFERLSGGQQQRLSVALALLARPRAVILDEITTGLDPTARRRIWRMIDHMRDDGVTVLLVSHAMNEVTTLCDRIAVLSAGRVIAHGTPEEVTEAAEASTLEDAFLTLTGHTASEGAST